MDTVIAGRCNTCKHWNRVIGTFKFGSCASPKFVYGYSKEEADPDGINVENDEGWGTCCGPLFGCIHYECLVKEE